MANDQHHSPLILFVTGEAPRSRRARYNLSSALKAAGLDKSPAHQIDLLRDPEQAISFGIFATPALMHIDAAGNRSVLYGDLSDQARLARFLSAL
ncbi:hypothetical protein BWR19_03055 [Halomonas sp. 1513]|nr:hypothetical protein BWR19_03055 [Halomonas sp. 1513]